MSCQKNSGMSQVCKPWTTILLAVEEHGNCRDEELKKKINKKTKLIRNPGAEKKHKLVRKQKAK